MTDTSTSSVSASVPHTISVSEVSQVGIVFACTTSYLNAWYHGISIAQIPCRILYHVSRQILSFLHHCHTRL